MLAIMLRTIFLVFLAIFGASASTPELGIRVTQKKHFVPAKASSALDVFYFDGLPWDPLKLFADVYIKLNITDGEKKDSCQIYQGTNRSQVEEAFSHDQRLFGLFRGLVQWRTKQLTPFERTFVGVSTNQAYEISVVIWAINFVRFFACITALVLFYYARKLVRKVVFYYTSGCAFGLLASLLLVAIVIHRFVPKASYGIPLLLSGWSFSLYLVYAVWNNLYRILMEYQRVVAVYVVTVMLLSFAVCYRYGPPTDVRSLNLAQWALQALCLLTIYASIQIPEISLSIIAVLIIWATLPDFVPSYLTKLRRRLFPVKRRMLTEFEYEQEGEIETQKALKELREYCQSPEANAWRIAARVKDPKRFASFVSGSSSHVSVDESFLHDQISADADMMDVLDDAAMEDDSDEEAVEWNSSTRKINGHLNSDYRFPNSRFSTAVSSSGGAGNTSPREKYASQLSMSFAGTSNLRKRLLEGKDTANREKSFRVTSQGISPQTKSMSKPVAAARAMSGQVQTRRSMPVAETVGRKKTVPGRKSPARIPPRYEENEYMSDDSD